MQARRTGQDFVAISGISGARGLISEIISGISSGILRGNGAVVAFQERAQKLAIGSDLRGFAVDGNLAIERNQRQSAIQRNRRRSAIERNQWRSAIESDDEGEIYALGESTYD